MNDNKLMVIYSILAAVCFSFKFCFCANVTLNGVLSFIWTKIPNYNFSVVLRFSVSILEDLSNIEYK